MKSTLKVKSSLKKRAHSESEADDSSSDGVSQSASDSGSLSSSESEIEDDSEQGSLSDTDLSESEAEEVNDEADPFNNAVEALLGSKLKAHARDTPILVRNKTPARKLEEAKLEAKAKKLLRKEKLDIKDRARVKDVVPGNVDAAGRVLQAEKKLKRTAQRGVIQLFNAIYASQKESADVNSKSIGIDKREKQATAVSKEKFLEMIKSG